MTRALVSEKWQAWYSQVYSDGEVITPFLSLFQGAVADLGQGQAGALVHVFMTSGGVDDTILKIYRGSQVPGASAVRDTEAQKTITLPTAANTTLTRTFWVPWEDVGDGFYLGFENTTGGLREVSTYHKRLWTP